MSNPTHHTAKIRAALAAMKQAADAQLLATADLREAINDYDAYLLDWAEHQAPSDEYQLTNVTESAPDPATAHPADMPAAKTPVTEPTPEPVEDTPEPTQPDPEPEPAASDLTPPAVGVTLADVRTKLSELSQAGHTAQVKQIITDLGHAKLSEVPEDKYPALLAAAEQVAA